MRARNFEIQTLKRIAILLILASLIVSSSNLFTAHAQDVDSPYVYVIFDNPSSDPQSYIEVRDASFFSTRQSPAVSVAWLFQGQEKGVVRRAKA